MPDISLGVVKNDEELLRALLNPDHVVDGEVLERAIPLKDLRERGFSIHRIAHVSPELVCRFIDKALSRTLQGTHRKFEGVARFKALAVRRIVVKDVQVFVIIDTALACNAGHASIYVADPTLSEGRTRQLRELLLPLLQERMSVLEAFNKD